MRQKSGIERFESPLPLGFCSRAAGPLAWSVGPSVPRYPRLAARGSRRLRRLVITRELSSLERLHSLVVQESEALLSLREICDFPLAAKTLRVFCHITKIFDFRMISLGRSSAYFAGVRRKAPFAHLSSSRSLAGARLRERRAVGPFQSRPWQLFGGQLHRIALLLRRSIGEARHRVSNRRKAF